MKTSSRYLLIVFVLLACGACAEVKDDGRFCATARCGSGTCNVFSGFSAAVAARPGSAMDASPEPMRPPGPPFITAPR